MFTIVIHLLCNFIVLEKYLNAESFYFVSFYCHLEMIEYIESSRRSRKRGLVDFQGSGGDSRSSASRKATRRHQSGLTEQTAIESFSSTSVAVAFATVPSSSSSTSANGRSVPNYPDSSSRSSSTGNKLKRKATQETTSVATTSTARPYQQIETFEISSDEEVPTEKKSKNCIASRTRSKAHTHPTGTATGSKSKSPLHISTSGTAYFPQYFANENRRKPKNYDYKLRMFMIFYDPK